MQQRLLMFSMLENYMMNPLIVVIDKACLDVPVCRKAMSGIHLQEACELRCKKSVVFNPCHVLARTREDLLA